VRRFDLALRGGDAEAIDKFWIDEYIFLNPVGQRLTIFDALGPQLREEWLRLQVRSLSRRRARKLQCRGLT